MDPSDSLYEVTYNLMCLTNDCRFASSREKSQSIISTARQEVTSRPWLSDLLPEWVEDFFGSFEVKPVSRPANPRHASLLPATVPNKAPFEDPFAGSRLAFGGPLSLHKASRQHGRRRKARIPAGAPAGWFRFRSQFRPQLPCFRLQFQLQLQFLPQQPCFRLQFRPLLPCFWLQFRLQYWFPGRRQPPVSCRRSDRRQFPVSSRRSDRLQLPVSCWWSGPLKSFLKSLL
ncbi:hypothetical protein OYC64_021300 [Pagothenia borchgrevinki]|uniref:Uncharacterized protein n=1 Tax=Pagothenia borchgrevinki TaxID=8213 RepID=A0ABD2FZ49_PAGBO